MERQYDHNSGISSDDRSLLDGFIEYWKAQEDAKAGLSQSICTTDSDDKG